MFSVMEEAFGRMEEVLGREELLRFVSCRYEDLTSYHFGFGTWIRNNLLENNDKLKNLFSIGGVNSKDDMSMLIIRLFYIYERNKLSEI